jgi:glycosyltransferase involved in cell wall biosynthesis
MMSQSQYRVSVVVPTFKRPDLLIRCLAALTAQDLDSEDYEVIIADDAACEETRRAVDAWRKVSSSLARGQRPGPEVRYVAVTGKHGPAAARNAGWCAARGEIIAFTDDDCIPESGWLRAGLAAFTAEVVGVTGRLTVPMQRIPTDYELNAAQLATARFVTANCFYRRAHLAAIGGFDERFTSAWREDSDLYFTLLERCAGETIPCDHLPRAVPLARAFIRAPDAVVVHPLRPAPWGVSLTQQRKSMFNALLYKKHPALYREKIQAAPPWHYYAIVGALLVAMGALLRRKQHIAFGAASFWIFMTGRFCLQRLERTLRARRHVAEMLVTSVLIPPLSIFWRIRGAIKFRVFFL